MLWSPYLSTWIKVLVSNTSVRKLKKKNAMGRSLGFNNIIQQEWKELRKACSKAEPVDRLYATGWPVRSTGWHWPFLDARPKMASGYRLQTNLRLVEAISRLVDTAIFFPPIPKTGLATGWCIASTGWKYPSFIKKKYSRLTIFVDIIVD